MRLTVATIAELERRPFRRTVSHPLLLVPSAVLVMPDRSGCPILLGCLRSLAEVVYLNYTIGEGEKEDARRTRADSLVPPQLTRK